MKPFRIPDWYRWLGNGIRPVLAALRSPRTGPWATTGRGSLWIHGASLGELKGSIRLAKAMRHLGPVLLTSTTTPGLAKLRRELPDSRSCLLPLDQQTTVRAFLDAVQPKCAIFLEAEAWPCLLQELAMRRVPVAFAAFRDQGASLHRWKRFGRLFPGWTRTVATVWTRNPDRTAEVASLGFADVRPGTALKWVGATRAAPDLDANCFAALSIHSSDFPHLAWMARSHQDQGWLWYPRRQFLHTPLRWWAAWCGLKTTSSVPPGPGEVWISPAFGMVASTLPCCRRAWVSRGHDLQEPHYLGTSEVFTGSSMLPVPHLVEAQDRFLEEIGAWIHQIPID